MKGSAHGIAACLGQYPGTVGEVSIIIDSGDPSDDDRLKTICELRIRIARPLQAVMELARIPSM